MNLLPLSSGLVIELLEWVPDDRRRSDRERLLSVHARGLGITAGEAERRDSGSHQGAILVTAALVTLRMADNGVKGA